MTRQTALHSLDFAADLNPNVLQRQASDPSSSVWVGASAGTGKTKVLTDRILRLLLPQEDGKSGADPTKILCLTFTNAAANEMVLRLSKTLAEWAIVSDEVLRKKLQDLLGRPAREDELKAARQLFAKTADMPGRMKIMTVHSFCQSVLSRFPLEAGLAPGFMVIEEGETTQLLAQARRLVVSGAQEEVLAALARLAGVINEDQFSVLLGYISRERYQFKNLLDRHFGVDGFYAALCGVLGIQQGLEPEDILAEGCKDQAFDAPSLRKCCDVLMASKASTDQGRGFAIQNWLNLDLKNRISGFEAYKSAYLSQEGHIRKSLITADLSRKNPNMAENLMAEAQRISNVVDSASSASCALLTRDLLFLAQGILSEYEILKARRGCLDFNDLILKTLALVQTCPGWVQYKLDQGIDHILVDEAQDTNPEQWKIIEALGQEFYAGQGASEKLRTIFVVGDEKQSIYSFHRASPEEFFRMRNDFRQKITQVGAGWRDVDLNISFRSVQSVLDVVDAVFQKTKHHSFRKGQAGLVELWPIFFPPEKNQIKEKESGWSMPDEIRNYRTGSSKLCEHIAQTIRSWIDQKEILPSRGRPIRPGDIMILVRTRNAFVHQLARSLKNLAIPLSGIDQLVLSKDLAVQDVLAAADFSLLPQNDLVLATLLKSPLIGMSEESLYDIAYGRPSNLWHALQKSNHKEIVEYLEFLIRSARTLKPYDFLMSVYHSACPADSVSGLRGLKCRLGPDVEDSLGELLNEALLFEMNKGSSLQEFLHLQQSQHFVVKREQDEIADRVRIMTVHGAKGLQSPIVILPDTLRVIRGSPAKADNRFLWPDKTGLPVPLWSPQSRLSCSVFETAQGRIQEREEEEYRRLLYVAMTRAEDRLYIGGYQGKREPLKDSWYFDIERGIKALEGTEVLADGSLRFSANFSPDYVPDRVDTNKQTQPVSQDLPSWLYETLPPESSVVKSIIRPSGDSLLSPLEYESDFAFQRGYLIHKLLEIVPDISSGDRRLAAEKFLAKNGSNLSEDIQKDLLDQVFRILDDPVFSPIFNEGSQAEVSFSGVTPDGYTVHGRVDRLLVTSGEIFILDYKTGRFPLDKAGVPAVYLEQLKLYADVIGGIYPGRLIRCALLWTEGPFLMPVDYPVDPSKLKG